MCIRDSFQPFSHAADVDHILPHSVTYRRRIVALLHQFDALRRLQFFQHDGQVDVLAHLQRDAQAVAEEHRCQHAGGGHIQGRGSQQCLQFACQSLLQLGVARLSKALATAAMEAAATALADGAPGADDAYADALEEWLVLGGADFDERLEIVSAELGLGCLLYTSRCV